MLRLLRALKRPACTCLPRNKLYIDDIRKPSNLWFAQPYFSEENPIFVLPWCQVNQYCSIPSVSNPDEIQYVKQLLETPRCKKYQNRVTIGKHFEENVSLLRAENCEYHEMLECPEVLNMDPNKLRLSIRTLKECDTTISLGHIRCVRSTNNATLKSVKAYQEKTAGCASIGKFWQQKLQCNTKLLTEMLAQNPRLFLGVQLSTAKLELLQKYHSAIDVFIENSAVLQNVPLKELQRRLEEMSALGWSPPPLKVLMQTKVFYQNRLENYVQKNVPEKGQSTKQLAELFKTDTVTLVNQLGPIIRRKRSTLTKIHRQADYLLHNKMYTAEEIFAEKKVLAITFRSLKNIFEVLGKIFPDEKIALWKIVSFHKNKQIRNRNRKNVLLAHMDFLTRLLECQKDQIDLSVTCNLTKGRIKDQDILQNHLFLTNNCGFTNTDLQQLPLVLMHNSEALQEVWDIINHENDVEVLMKQAPQKVLHLIQNCMEKATNFQQNVVLDKKWILPLSPNFIQAVH